MNSNSPTYGEVEWNKYALSISNTLNKIFMVVFVSVHFAIGCVVTSSLLFDTKSCYFPPKKK